MLDIVNTTFTYWKQRVKDVWLKSADTSAKVGYTRVKIRSKGNLILALKDNMDIWVSTQEDLLSLVVSNLQSIYSPDPSQALIRDINSVLNKMDLPRLFEEQCSKLLSVPFRNQISHVCHGF